MYGPLLFANLFRNVTRLSLTFGSLAVAFLLFVLLRAITTAFSGDAAMQGSDRLVVDAKFSMTDNLPITQLRQIRALDGVAEATNISWFGGYYRDPKETFTTFPVDPPSFFSVFDDYTIDPAVLKRFSSIRRGVVASQSLAEKYGWSPGDLITLRGDIWPKEDGSWDWQFEFIGTFDNEKSSRSSPLFLLQYAYFDEAVAVWAKNQIGFFVVRVDPAHRPEDVAKAIDKLFENSGDPTRTASEDQYSRQFVEQLVDVGLVSSAVLGAVFFTILLLTGNTASQTFRERTSELAMMKTVGFTDAAVSALVLAESIALCLAGGLAGIALAFMARPVLQTSLGDILGRFEIGWQSLAAALLLSVAIGTVIGAQPAWAARRLSIVEALRR